MHYMAMSSTIITTVRIIFDAVSISKVISPHPGAESSTPRAGNFN